MTNLLTIVSLIALMMFGANGDPAAERQRAPDESAILQFQRTADTYAFTHRQADRRGAGPTARVEGAMFTPVVSAVLRERIRTALKRPGCVTSNDASAFVVPRVNEPSTNLPPVAACVAAALPRLPDELHYLAAGPALVPADAHLHVVVDVMHAAFPTPDN